MKASEILKGSCELITTAGCADPASVDITSVEYDSRRAGAGSMFVAVKGFESDGHSYIEAAVKNGCRCVLISDERLQDFIHLESEGVMFLVSHDSRRALSRVSSVFFGEPSKRLHITGITGTNGKTSITYLLESIYNSSGYSCGVIGTVNYRWKGKVLPAPNTTPESKDIQELLKQMLDDGVTHVVMEVSSHALYLDRVEDVCFDSAVFTNLTQDHLDFHKTFDAYFDAKRRLFELLEKSCKQNRAAIINTDDDYGRRIYESHNGYTFKMISYGESEGAVLLAAPESIDNSITGISYRFVHGPDRRDIKLKLAGRFQVYNSLAALGSALYSGVDIDDVIKGMSKLDSVPGRLQVVDTGAGFYAVVDYAHTGDALLKLLQSVNEMPHNRVITVFGCGGDRDRTKRPVMGKIAVDNSDFAVVTSDNPRTEDANAIIDDIMKGITGGSYIVEPDREKAIEAAINIAEKGDVVVIAGKGHEDYQIIGKTKHHFDDREMALKYMNGKKN
jgi:UDP-N-acetylmuramoyl-L-alanyl-D-glutamate--2,6-diaminopimelate ligase